MANRFYIEGEGRAAAVQDLFAAVAPRYDLINDLQSLGLPPEQEAAPASPSQVNASGLR